MNKDSIILKGRTGEYSFGVFWPNEERLNPDNDCASVVVQHGKSCYSGLVLTQQFIRGVFREYKKTGECANGSYFGMPYYIIIKRIDTPTIKKTLDDLIKNGDFDNYFHPVEE